MRLFVVFKHFHAEWKPLWRWILLNVITQILVIWGRSHFHLWSWWTVLVQWISLAIVWYFQVRSYKVKGYEVTLNADYYRNWEILRAPFGLPFMVYERKVLGEGIAEYKIFPLKLTKKGKVSRTNQLYTMLLVKLKLIK